MRLERIKVSGFKSFKELDLELRSLNVLIGANGSGKSNFISLFRLLNAMVAPGLGLQNFVAKNGRVEAFLHYGSKITHRIRINLYIDETMYFVELSPSIDEGVSVSAEGGLVGDLGFVLLEKNNEADLVGQLEPGIVETNQDIELQQLNEAKRQILKNLKSIRVFHFHDTSDTAAVKRASPIHDVAYLRSEGENLAAFLYHLKHHFAREYESIRSIVQLVAPFFDDFVLQLLPGLDESVSLNWRERGSDYPFRAYQLSDGTLRFICLATVLNLPDEYLPSVILIDEPELGLHPFALSVFAGLVRKASYRTQVIISTQSVPLVNEFNPEDLLVVNRNNGVSVIERPQPAELESWLEDYSLGELWEKNVIGGRP